MITSFYAAILALLYLWLSIAVLRRRRTAQIALGIQQDSILEKRIRAHANFIEYVPLCLILLSFTESQLALTWIVHLTAGLLVIGRILHAFGISQQREDYRFRVAGMGLTFTAIGTNAVILILQPLL